MIKSKKVLTLIEDSVEPADAQAIEIVLEREVLQHDALLHIGTCTDYILTLGKRSLLKFYNLEKLKEDNIFVHRRPYGGSGTIYGPQDVLFSLYVNKDTFLRGFDVDAQHAYRFFNRRIRDALQDLGLDCYIDEDEAPRRVEDGVCAHLQGRSEIRAVHGNTRMVASVFREDEVGFYMRGMVIVTADWTKVYQYLDSPTEPLYPLDCLEMQLDRTDLTEPTVDAVVNRFQDLFYTTELVTSYRESQLAAIRGIRHKYRVI